MRLANDPQRVVPNGHVWRVDTMVGGTETIEKFVSG